jgi:hypothetical protein
MGILQELYARPLIYDDDIFGDDAIMPDAEEKAFNEQDHPRADDGKFGEGSGGSVKPGRESGDRRPLRPSRQPEDRPDHAKASDCVSIAEQS